MFTIWRQTYGQVWPFMRNVHDLGSVHLLGKFGMRLCSLQPLQVDASSKMFRKSTPT